MGVLRATLAHCCSWVCAILCPLALMCSSGECRDESKTASLGTIPAPKLTAAVTKRVCMAERRAICCVYPVVVRWCRVRVMVTVMVMVTVTVIVRVVVRVIVRVTARVSEKASG
jgi:hypothetical protein